MATCNPLRVDHLDYNDTADHDVAQIVPSSVDGKCWIVWTSRMAAGGEYGIYMREYDVVNHVLGDVLTIQDDATGTGRVGSSSPLTGNEGPNIVRLSSGRFIVAYNSSSGGVFVRESDNGFDWTDEHQLFVPVVGNEALHKVVAMATDGEDVFLVTVGLNLPILYDLYMFHRDAQDIWTRDDITDFSWGSQQLAFAKNAPRCMAIRRLSSYPYKRWSIVLVGRYYDTDPIPDIQEVVAYYCPNYTGSESGWTTKTIHDFVGDALRERSAMIRVGADNIYRVVYFGVPSLGGKIYGAYSTDYGDTWNDIGLLTVPNADQFWDSTFDRCIALDAGDNWFLSMMGGTTTDKWIRYKSTTETDNFTKIDCDLNEALPSPNDFSTVSVACVGDAVFVGAHHVRILSDVGSAPSRYRLWVVRSLNEGDPGQPGDEPIPDATSRSRRGVVQAQRMSSDYPRGQFSAISVENAKRVLGGKQWQEKP